MRDIVFLDKDETLGHFAIGEGLYRGAANFCRAQVAADRSLVIATSATETGRGYLAPIEEFISGYFGKDQCGAAWYETDDGLLREVDRDYAIRLQLPGMFGEAIREYKGLERHFLRLSRKEQRQDPSAERLQKLFKYLDELVHRKTGEPFERSRQYMNPHLGGSRYYKDLHLIRRLVGGPEHESLRTVMVGNESDVGAMSTDPLTPLIVVYRGTGRLAHGYARVSAMIDVLFDGGELHPWQVFDELRAAGDFFPIRKWNFRLERTEEGTRIIRPV